MFTWRERERERERERDSQLSNSPLMIPHVYSKNVHVA